MPSLRRSHSSPSVRSTPYPTSLSSGGGRAPGGHRRSSGSETGGRRVLADLEWWRVAEGQLESDNRPSGEYDFDFDAGAGDEQAILERPSTPAVSLNEDPSHELLVTLSTTQFAALSVAPVTPPRRRASRHSQDSSASSVESTPEIESPLESGLGRVLFDWSDLPMFLLADQVPTSTLPSRRPKRTRRPTPSLGRSHTFSHFTLPTAFPSAKDDYADFSMSPFSSHPPDLYD